MGRDIAIAKWKATVSFVTSVLPQVLRLLSQDTFLLNLLKPTGYVMHQQV